MCKIKPLQWDEWSAKTPMGSEYHVLPSAPDHEEWDVLYCFEEYYESSDLSFKDEQEAKAWCEADWQRRMLECLEKKPDNIHKPLVWNQDIRNSNIHQAFFMGLTFTAQQNEHGKFNAVMYIESGVRPECENGFDNLEDAKAHCENVFLQSEIKKYFK